VVIIHNKTIEPDLATYYLYMEKKNTTILIYSWLATGTYHKKSGDFDFVFLQNWRIWVIFFPEKAIV
jgi:hypothetical protein